MYDFHMHSNFSDDSNSPMAHMVAAAYDLGLTEIAITDHFDPNYPDPNFPFALDFTNYHKELERMNRQYENKIKVRKGIEIGIQHGETLALCSEAVNAYDYDFVIGSFHCAEGFDLYGSEYFEGRSVEASYLAFYEYMANCLKSYKDYDVLGHFNIIDRYTKVIPKASVYMDLVEMILKGIINHGKGIEINTSSFRYGLGERTTPAIEILKLYKELGGEIVTTGSDAHKPQDIKDHIEFAEYMIKSVGLRYVTTFEKRKPVFHKL